MQQKALYSLEMERSNCVAVHLHLHLRCSTSTPTSTSQYSYIYVYVAVHLQLRLDRESQKLIADNVVSVRRNVIAVTKGSLELTLFLRLINIIFDATAKSNVYLSRSKQVLSIVSYSSSSSYSSYCQGEKTTLLSYMLSGFDYTRQNALLGQFFICHHNMLH